MVRQFLQSSVLFAALAAMFAAAPASVLAQDAPPPTIAELESRLALDTADADAHFELAVLLMRQSPASELTLAERLRINTHFEAALRADHRDPRYLVGFAEWLLATGLQDEARRQTARALEHLASPEYAHLATDTLIATARRLGTAALAARVEDNRRLVRGDELSVASPECGDELFCQAYRRPHVFNAVLGIAPDLSGVVRQARAELAQVLEYTFRLNPAGEASFRALAAERFAEEEWEEAAAAARRHVEAAPDSPWGYLVLGTALWRAGRLEAGAGAMELGFDLLPQPVRAAWRDPAPIMPTAAAERLATADGEVRRRVAEAYWFQSDPLLLSATNERWVEHMAREVYVDLRFSAPELGFAGRETERGDVYLRLGPPRRVIYVARDARRETDRERMEQVLALMQCGDNPACLRQVESEGSQFTASHGGRYIFWVYDDDEPPFIFQSALRGRNPRHMFRTDSHLLAQGVANQVGSGYAPPFVVHDLAVQAARFRGADPGTTELVIVPDRPATLGELPVTRSGLFVLDLQMGRMVSRQEDAGAPNRLYSLRLPAAQGLRVRFEVLAEPEAAAAAPVRLMPRGRRPTSRACTPRAGSFPSPRCPTPTASPSPTCCWSDGSRCRPKRRQRPGAS